jgi:hypothetical protein
MTDLDPHYAPEGYIAVETNLHINTSCRQCAQDGMTPCAIGLCNALLRPDGREVHFIRNHLPLSPTASRTELPPPVSVPPPVPVPPPAPLTLRPFDVQDHSDDGRIDWYSDTGEFVSRESIEAELKRLGIPYTIVKE